MNATEARALTNQHIQNEVASLVLTEVHKRIREACEKGLCSIQNPQHSVEGKYLEPKAVQHLRRLLVDAGYNWEDFPNPDPGHPASSAYTTLSW